MLGGEGHIKMLVSCFAAGAAAGVAPSALAFFLSGAAHAGPCKISGRHTTRRSTMGMCFDVGRDLKFICFSIQCYLRVSRFLWQLSQNAILFAESLIRRSGCVEACG